MPARPRTTGIASIDWASRLRHAGRSITTRNLRGGHHARQYLVRQINWVDGRAALRRFACRKPRRRAEKGRHAQALSQRQSALDLAARGSDDCLGDTIRGDLQQSRRVRSGQGSRKHRHRDSGSRRELVLGFHQHETDLQASAGRQMARRPAVHGKGRAMHLADADREGR